MSEEVWRMPDEQLEDIRERCETLDTGAYYGADMLAAALLDRNNDVSDLLEEVDRLRAIERRLKESIATAMKKKEGMRRIGDNEWDVGNRQTANDYHAEAHREYIKQQALERILGEG